MLTLKPNQIDIWLVFSDEIKDEALLQQYNQLLTEEEEEKRKYFLFDSEERQYIITRALVRTVLSKYASIAPGDWSFLTNDYGKPIISNIDPIAQTISFNISHTSGLIMLGINYQQPIGVDTENITTTEPLTNNLSLHPFFSFHEINCLSQVQPTEYPCKFFEYWTLKESYIKAQGKGLSIPLEHIGFEWQDKSPLNVIFDPQWEDQAHHWRFWQFKILPHYIIAICAKRTISLFPPYISIKKIIPLYSENTVESILLRQF